MKHQKIDLDKLKELSVDKQSNQILQLFTVEPSFDNVYDENSHLFHKNEVLRFLLNHTERNSLFDALNIAWVYNNFIYPALFINDIEVFSDIVKGDIKTAKELSDYQIQNYNLKDLITGEEFLKRFARNRYINSKEKLDAAIILLKVAYNAPLYLENMPEPFFRYQFDDDFKGSVHYCFGQNIKLDIFASNEIIHKKLEQEDLPYNGLPLLPEQCKLIQNEAELKQISYDMNHNLLVHLEKMINRRVFIFQVNGKFPTVFIVENFQSTNHYQISKAYGMDYTPVRKKEMEEMTEILKMYENKVFFEANKPAEMSPEHKRELDALFNIL